MAPSFPVARLSDGSLLANGKLAKGATKVTADVSTLLGKHRTNLNMTGAVRYGLHKSFSSVIGRSRTRLPVAL